VSAHKILITGAFGRVGLALKDLPGEKVLMDLRVPPSYAGPNRAVQGKVQDRAAVRDAMQGCDAIVHLAASPAVDSSWDEVLQNNILATEVLLESAKELGVERVVFASSNHAVGMVEIENAPRIYEEGHGILVTKESETRPDSLYGVSKVFGENLGRYYAENGGPRFYGLRIGALSGEGYDHPYSDAELAVERGECERGDATYKLKVRRHKAIWLSRRDLAQLVALCLEYNGPAFDIFYGVSDNPARWLDIDYARKQLGYQPQDSSAHWNAAPAGKVAA
jgi:nucleoside-diphosphate-sugar epimerase